jgi:hypothetical protein
MLLLSPHARAKVLGTSLAFSVDRDASRLDVLDGLVAFSRRDRPVTLEVGAGGYALARAGQTFSANARYSKPEGGWRTIDDHAGGLLWRQSPLSTPLTFGIVAGSSPGNRGLKVHYEPKPGDRYTYGQLIHPLALRPRERLLRFSIEVQHFEGNADWNIQFRLQDRTCWVMGGSLFSELSRGRNLIEIDLAQSPANTYGGKTYRQAQVREMIFSVCQGAATCVIDEFSVR